MFSVNTYKFIEGEAILKVFLNLCEQTLFMLNPPVLVVIVSIHLTDFPFPGSSKHFWFAAAALIK